MPDDKDQKTEDPSSKTYLTDTESEPVHDLACLDAFVGWQVRKETKEYLKSLNQLSKELLDTIKIRPEDFSEEATGILSDADKAATLFGTALGV